MRLSVEAADRRGPAPCRARHPAEDLAREPADGEHEAAEHLPERKSQPGFGRPMRQHFRSIEELFPQAGKGHQSSCLAYGKMECSQSTSLNSIPDPSGRSLIWTARLARERIAFA